MPDECHVARPAPLPRSDGAAIDELDRMLARRFADGDEDALAEIAEHYWSSLVKFAAGLVGNVDEAQDVAQESFVRLWRQQDGWTADRPLRPFLCTVAHNLARNVRRHHAVEARFAAVQRTQPAVHSPSVAQLYDSDVLQDTVKHAIRDLPERRRQVFLLARMEGYSHRQIAQHLGISLPTVANHVSAALLSLRSALA